MPRYHNRMISMFVCLFVSRKTVFGVLILHGYICHIGTLFISRMQRASHPVLEVYDVLWCYDYGRRWLILISVRCSDTNELYELCEKWQCTTNMKVKTSNPFHCVDRFSQGQISYLWKPRKRKHNIFKLKWSDTGQHTVLYAMTFKICFAPMLK